MSSNSLLESISNYISNKVIKKLFENSCQNFNNQSITQVLEFCNRMNISSVEYFSSFVSERMIKLLHNLHFTNELCLEYLLLATILFERVLENPLVLIDGNNFIDFFIICVTIFLKFNNDYYYLPCIIRNSQILQYDFSRYETFVLEAIDYKLFISEIEFEVLKVTIISLTEMNAIRKSKNNNNIYMNDSQEKFYYNNNNNNNNNNHNNNNNNEASNLLSGTQEKEKTCYVSNYNAKNNKTTVDNSSLISSNYNNKKSKKSKIKKNTVSSILKDDHVRLVQKIQSSNDEIYNNYMKNYYEAQQVQIQKAPIFIIQNL
jgi:hypothetical protein